MKTIKLDNKKWIGEQIESDIPKWSKGDIITIEAGTGTGKSYFIKNDLYDYAKANGKKILMLVHRVNIRQQFSIEFKRDRKFDVFDILTYQTIESMDKKGEKFDFNKYEYIVCDEFHYFTGDSPQNNSTTISLNAVLNENDKIRIFMSATGDLVINHMSGNNLLDYSYVAPLDFSFIRNLYFYSKNSTENRIINELSENDGKTIVFVNDLNKIEELYLEYKDISMMNCSKSASKYRYVDESKIEKMLTKDKFEDEILFSTTVMDTGVSLKDKEINSIVCINIVDMGSLIQVLGRKRMLDEDDRIDVYIRVPDNRSIGGYWKQTNDKLRPFLDFAKLGDIGYINKYGRQEEDKSIVYYHSNVLKDGSIEVSVGYNQMALIKFASNFHTYRGMIDKGYKSYVLRTLKRDKNDYIDIEKENEADMLEEYLQKMIGIRLFVGSPEREALIEMINLRDRNNRLIKTYDVISKHIEHEFNKDYIIIDKTSYTNENYRKKYWQIVHTDNLQ